MLARIARALALARVARTSRSRARGLREPWHAKGQPRLRERAACADFGAGARLARARLAPHIYIYMYICIYLYIALVTHSWHTPLLGPHIRLVTYSRHIYTYLYIYLCIALVTHRWHTRLLGPNILPEKAGPAKASHENAIARTWRRLTRQGLSGLTFNQHSIAVWLKLPACPPGSAGPCSARLTAGACHSAGCPWSSSAC